MSTAELRRVAKEKIDALPSEQLRSVVDFIGYLASEPSNLPRPSLSKRLAQAEKDIAADHLTPVTRLRRKY